MGSKEPWAPLNPHHVRMRHHERVPADKRLERMKFYHMNYAACGDGTGWYAEILIAVDTEYCDPHEGWLRTAALLIGGHPISFVMGGHAVDAWTLRKASREQWEGRSTWRRAGIVKPIEALFLSDGPPVPGWPEPARMEDLMSPAALSAKVENRSVYGFSGFPPDSPIGGTKRGAKRSEP